MPPISRIAALVGLVVLLPACARTAPHPVVSRDPVPPSPLDYKVACDPGIVLLNPIVRNCRVVDPAVIERRSTVVRAKG